MKLSPEQRAQLALEWRRVRTRCSKRLELFGPGRTAALQREVGLEWRVALSKHGLRLLSEREGNRRNRRGWFLSVARKGER